MNLNQPQISEYFLPVGEYNSVDSHILRLWSELLCSCKIKYFAYNCDNIPEDGQQPPLWFNFANRLRAIHPLSLEIFQIIMQRRNYTLPVLHRCILGQAEQSSIQQLVLG